LSERADVVLLDVMMPGMDGFETCRRLKAKPRTQHIPVIMVTARSISLPTGLGGLEPGADDFLTKPVDDTALVKRVRNLARLKMLTDEMLMSASTEQMGFAGALATPFDQVARGGQLLVVEPNDHSYEPNEDALKDEFTLTREPDPASALLRLTGGDFDLLIVSLNLEHADGLRLCSQSVEMAILDR
jgi:two-component system, cell cycle response regulator